MEMMKSSSPLPAECSLVVSIVEVVLAKLGPHAGNDADVAS